MRPRPTKLEIKTTRTEKERQPDDKRPQSHLFDQDYSRRSENHGDSHPKSTGDKEQRDLFSDFSSASARDGVQRTLGLIDPLYHGRYFMEPSSSSDQLQYKQEQLERRLETAFAELRENQEPFPTRCNSRV